MSEALEVRAEIAKLARLLTADAEELKFLDRVGSVDLRALREQLVELFYGGEVGGLKRFVGPSKILPASVIASITQDAVGPVLAARIAGLVDSKQAIAVVSKLPIAFLADISVELDPRRVSAVIGGLPSKTIADISGALAKRKDYVAMGRFVTYLTDEALAGTFESASDADLLQIAFVMEDKSRLTLSVAMLSDKRLSAILKVAGKQELWPEALDLLTHLDDEQYGRLIDLVAEQSDATIDKLVRSSHEDNLWTVTIPITSDMTNPDPVVCALLRGDGAWFKSFVDETVAEDRWHEVRALLEKLPAERLAAIRDRAAENRQLGRLAPVKDLLDGSAVVS